MNSLGVVLSPGGLAGAERSEGERSEPQRSAATAKAGADSAARARPDPEVVAKAKRRTYTAEYKQRIMAEAEAAAGPGRSAPSRRSVLVAVDLLAARAGRWNPEGLDSAETRAEVAAQSTRRRKSEASPSECRLE
jgi:transposase